MEIEVFADTTGFRSPYITNNLGDIIFDFSLSIPLYKYFLLSRIKEAEPPYIQPLIILPHPILLSPLL